MLSSSTTAFDKLLDFVGGEPVSCMLSIIRIWESTKPNELLSAPFILVIGIWLTLSDIYYFDDPSYGKMLSLLLIFIWFLSEGI